MKHNSIITMSLVITAMIGCQAAFAQDTLAEQGRAVFTANQPAVVTIGMVISISFGGEQRESDNEANATIIDPSGLAVLPLSVVDPTAMFNRMGGSDEQVSSTIKTMKMIMSDGTEIPVKVVLRDAQLDLAFTRPEEKVETPFPYVSLDNPGKPEILDPILVVAQLGRVTRRAHSATITRIEAIVDKPRTFYVPSEDRADTIICAPAFTLDNRFIGVGVTRTIKSSETQRMRDSSMVIIVPVADIKEAMAQVPAYGEDGKAVEAPAASASETEAPASDAQAPPATAE